MFLSILSETDIPNDIIGIISIVVALILGIVGFIVAKKTSNNKNAKSKIKGNNNIVTQNSEINKK